MGKFEIGTRVSDAGGDIGKIVGKPRKGWRTIGEYEGLWAGSTFDYRKSDLSILPDAAPVEVVAEAASKWVPKVGDRVRMRHEESDEFTTVPATVRKFDPKYSMPILIEFDDDVGFGHDGHAGFLPNKRGWYVNEDNLELIPATAPASEWIPAVGDLVRCNDKTGAPSHYTVGKIYEVESFNGSIVRCKGVNAGMYASRFSPVPLTIEAGRYYKTRDGQKASVTRGSDFYGPNSWWTLVDGDGCSVLDSGFEYEGETSPRDLVAEWVEPVAEPVAISPWASGKRFDPVAVEEVAEATATPAERNRKFKIGDKIVRVGNDAPWAPLGYESVVGKGFTYTDNTGCDFTLMVDEDWELAPEVAPPAKFKIGDRVRVASARSPHLEKYVGTEFTIDTDEEKTDGVQAWSGNDHKSPYRFLESHLELATPTTTPLTIGDAVTLTAPARITGFDKRNAHIVLDTGGSFVLPIASLLRAA